MTRMRMIALCGLAALAIALLAAAGASAASRGAAAWGANAAGQLGDGTTVSSDAPVAVSGLSEITTLAAGGDHSLALLSNGTVMAWGDNSSGQLGNGTTTSSDVPVLVSGLSGVTAIAAGDGHSLALLNNGTVMAWGNNAKGQLGNGTINSSDVPVAVSGLSGVTAIAAGGSHSMALLRTGTVMGWGENLDGQVGNGTTSNGELTPVAVSGLSGATAISAGGYHSLALLGNGTVAAWGENADGQLGNGTTTNSDVPVAVSAVTTAKAISAGGRHSLALLSAGTVMAWGNNAKGQLGNGTTVNSDTPVAVSALSNVVAVAAGAEHSVALESSETVMDWGANSQGQLGNGTTTSSSTPVSVTGLTEVKGVAAGAYDTFAAGPQVATVTSVSPVYGRASGGTSVTISGSNFTGATAVHFGSALASSFTVSSATEIIAVAPAGTGVVDVTVTTPKGTSAATSAGQFSYLPSVSSVSPSSGPQGGGTTVTISGTNFEATTAVKFGAKNASSFKVESSSSIKAIAPAGAGTVEVTVTTPGGTSLQSSGDLFTYNGSAPEFGRCVKEKHTGGRYADAACTQLGGAGHYEWLPGPGAKSGFTTKTKTDSTFTLETVTGASLTCKSVKGTGEYTGPHTVGNVELTFSGCETAGAKCSTANGKAGVLETKRLEGSLGIIKTSSEGAVNDEIGLDLKASGGVSLVEFSCGSVAGSWRGSVIVPVTSNKMLRASVLKYKATAGHQAVEAFEGQPKDIIESSLTGGPFVQSAWSLTTSVTNKEAIEVNSVV